MAESDDYPELVPESSTASIAAHNAFDREVLDAEKGFNHIAGDCPTSLPKSNLLTQLIVFLSIQRSIRTVARLLQSFVQDAG